MQRSTKRWRTRLYVLLITVLCGGFAFPAGNTQANAAPLTQTGSSCTSGNLIAEWTFTGLTAFTSYPIASSSGIGSLRATTTPPPTFPTSSSATPPAISFSGWPTGSLDTTKYIEIAASTLGNASISLKFDASRSNTGPTTFEVHYSTDGTNFIPLPPAQILNASSSSSMTSYSFDFGTIPGLNDNPNAKFRLLGYSAGASGGVWRLDNIVLCGNPIVIIDSITPNPTNTDATLIWHALENGNYDIRIGGTSCTDGTSIASGAYSTSPSTIPITIGVNSLVEGTNAIYICLIDSSANVHSATNTIRKDTTVPTVTVNQATGQADPANSLPINFAVVFSEPIDPNSFTESDIIQTGSATSITWTKEDSGDHINFTLRATAVTGAGTLIPSIPANAVTDLAGNGNTASTSTDNSVNYAAIAPLTVIINEVAWSGSAANSDDEWIELHNPSTSPVNVTGWQLYGDDNTVNRVGNPNIALSGTIPAGGYFLLERVEQATNVTADQVYSTGDLVNSGERLYLKDNSGNIIDTANVDGSAWPAGTAATPTTPYPYASMERVATANQWVTYGGTVPIAQDRNGGPIRGTPGAANWIRSTSITTITSDTPDPSLINANVTVTVTVIGGATTPTGTVNISGANTNCSITLSSGTGSCVVKFTTAGTKTITATYISNSGHPNSNDTETHQVNTSSVVVPTIVPTPRPPPELVAINEFVPRPGHDWNNDGVVNVGDEYIELLNHGIVNVNLNGYSLDDEVNVGSSPFRLPSVTIRPGERIVFYGSETGLLLSDGGDGVRLLKPNGQLADAFNYTIVGYPDQSYCRLPDNGGADDWNQTCFPTPGLQNSLSGVSPVPVNHADTELYCPIADTLPDDFAQAECAPFGNNIWDPAYWDQTGWYGEKYLPGIIGKWPVFAN